MTPTLAARYVLSLTTIAVHDFRFTAPGSRFPVFVPGGPGLILCHLEAGDESFGVVREADAEDAIG